MAKLTSVSLNGNSSDVADAYSKSETDTLLAGKQATLTPGNHIQISGNTISVDTTGTSICQGGDGGLATNKDVVSEVYSIDSELTTYGVDITVPACPEKAYPYGTSVLIGIGAEAGGTDNSIVIGENASVSELNNGHPPYMGNIAIGANATVSGEDDFSGGIAIGHNAHVFSSSAGSTSVALGNGSVVTDDSDNVVSIGSSSVKRAIINVADGALPHCAATKGQLDAAIAALQAQIDALRS